MDVVEEPRNVSHMHLTPGGDRTQFCSLKKRSFTDISVARADFLKGIITSTNSDEKDIVVSASSESGSIASQVDPLNNDIDSNAPKFKQGDKVFVIDQGEVYLATIKKPRCPLSCEGLIQWEYKVHFHGWNSRHDRWVKEHLVMPEDDDRSKQMAEESKSKALEADNERKQKKAQAEKEKKERKSTKQKRQLKSQNVLSGFSLEDFALPFTLKRFLADDQRIITQLGKYTSQGYDTINAADTTPARMVHDLPASISIERLLKHFAKSVIKEKKESKKVIEDDGVESKYASFATDMTNIFNAVLPKYLLYSAERAQYLKLCSDGEMQSGSAAKVYSGEFLLRLLVRLPDIISSFKTVGTSGETNDMSAFQEWMILYESEGDSLGVIISELIIFLQKNSEKIFKGKYREPNTDEYTEEERAFSLKMAKKKR